AFLEGRDIGLLAALENRMTAASSSLHFEKAAALRDKLIHLQWLHDRLARVRAACGRPPFFYRVRGHDGINIWYLIRQGAVTAAFSAPGSVYGNRLTAGTIQQATAGKNRSAVHLPVQFMDGVYLVASWFRRHPDERKHVLSLSEARRRCART